MTDDIYCDSGHLCVICWTKERRDAIHRWLFRRLPVRWRHRITMREAMRRRRVWRERQKEGRTWTLWADPRMAHRERRLWRSLMSNLARCSFPTYRNVEWVEVGDPATLPSTFAESYQCPRCEKTLRHDKAYCPLFPEVSPPRLADYSTGSLVTVPGRKWDRCVCLVHTCYDAAALRRGQ